MDIVDYHIFINLLVNHIKMNFVEYRQFVIIFALVYYFVQVFFCAIKNETFFVQ